MMGTAGRALALFLLSAIAGGIAVWWGVLTDANPRQRGPTRVHLSPQPYGAPVADQKATRTERVGAPIAASRQARGAEFKQRDAGEWQGMLIDLSVAPTCEQTAHCSLGQTCRAGRCTPCEADSECMAHEVCVLDHCVKRDLATCRRAADCNDTLCVLSGYSTGARNNEATTAQCADVNAGVPSDLQEPRVGVVPSLTSGPPPPVQTSSKPASLAFRLERRLRKTAEVK